MGAQLLFDVMGAVGRQKAADMPAPHRHLMIVLANFADDEGVAWPSKSTLAAATGHSASVIFETLGELEAAGWLERLRDGGGRASTAYRVSAGGTAVAHTRPGRHAKRDDAASEEELGAGAIRPPDSSPPPQLEQPSAPRIAAMCGADSSPPPPAYDPPKDPPNRTTQGPPQRAGAAGQPTLPLTLVGGPTPKEPSRKSRRTLAPKEPTSLQRYAAAYASGITDAAGGAFTPPTDSHAKHVFRTILPVHAKTLDGKPLREAELDAWIRESAAEYRRARADRAAFEGGFKPSNWKAWLESGKASPEARAPPIRKGPVRQGLPEEMRKEIAGMWE